MGKAVSVIVLLGLCLWGFLTVSEMAERPLAELTLKDLLEMLVIGFLAYAAGKIGMDMLDK